MHGRAVAFVSFCLFAAGLAGGCGGAVGADTSGALIVRAVPWAGHGTWIKGDTHIHTTFSDGNQTPADVVDQAIKYGVQAIAITDHSDRNLNAATPEYEQTIKGLRSAHPDVVFVAGIEWNIPPSGGEDHAVVLVPPGPMEWQALAYIKEHYDDYHNEGGGHKNVAEALAWLAANGANGALKPVVIFNHPSRREAHSIDNAKDIQRWRTVNDLVIGFEGGPGHQGSKPLGAYSGQEQPIDRWDPVVARVGDAWDTLLGAGMDVSGAYAVSDFHTPQDYWPGQFSETWLYVPEKSPEGVIRALRAGAMFGVHGHIARNVDFVVEAPGLSRPAMAGETIDAASGSTVTAKVKLDIPPTDWEGKPNRIDAIELIAVTRDNAQIVATRPPAPGAEAFSETVTVPTGGIVLRARGRRTVEDGPSLMFYTNPIRIVAK